MNRVDRAPGVSLVTDHPADSYQAPPTTDIPEIETPEPLVWRERHFGGLRVQVGWHPALGWTVFAQVGENRGHLALIEKDSREDAFDHPSCYIPALHGEL